VVTTLSAKYPSKVCATGTNGKTKGVGMGVCSYSDGVVGTRSRDKSTTTDARAKGYVATRSITQFDGIVAVIEVGRYIIANAITKGDVIAADVASLHMIVKAITKGDSIAADVATVDVGVSLYMIVKAITKGDSIAADAATEIGVSLHMIVKTITKGNGIAADVATGGVHMITINVIENEPVIGYGYISNKRGINITGHFSLLLCNRMSSQSTHLL